MVQAQGPLPLSTYLCLAGPLIRILGDRFPWEMKAAILNTLGLLIGKGGVALKPFVPQLQTTFLKCLADPVSSNNCSGCHVSGVCFSPPLHPTPEAWYQVYMSMPSSLQSPRQWSEVFLCHSRKLHATFLKCLADPPIFDNCKSGLIVRCR